MAPTALRPMSPSHEPYYLVFSTLIGDDPASILPHLSDHLAYLKPHHESGRMALGGAFQTLDGNSNGNGMYALAVASLEEAREIVENDPFHRRAVRRYEIVIWQWKVAF